LIKSRTFQRQPSAGKNKQLVHRNLKSETISGLARQRKMGRVDPEQRNSFCNKIRYTESVIKFSAQGFYDRKEKRIFPVGKLYIIDRDPFIYLLWSLCPSTRHPFIYCRGFSSFFAIPRLFCVAALLRFKCFYLVDCTGLTDSNFLTVFTAFTVKNKTTHCRNTIPVSGVKVKRG